MKTIAATALILTLTASAFAAEPQIPQAQGSETASAPIVLSTAQLDGVTAAGGGDVAMEELTLAVETVETDSNNSEWKYVNVRRF